MKTITKDDNVVDFLRESVVFLEEETMALGENNSVRFRLSFFDEKNRVDGQYYRSLGEIFIRKLSPDEIESRLDKAALSNHLSADTFLVAEIDFIISEDLNGQIDFIREYKNDFLMKEFMSIRYYVFYKQKKYCLNEVTIDWQQNHLIVDTLCHAAKSPKWFIKRRITHYKSLRN